MLNMWDSRDITFKQIIKIWLRQMNIKCIFSGGGCAYMQYIVKKMNICIKLR